MIFNILAAINEIDSDEDRSLLLTIYREHYARMRWTILRITHSPQDVDDLIGDTLLRLVPHLDLLHRLTPGQLGKYVRKTAETVALKFLQKKNREVVSPPEEMEKYADLDDGPEDTSLHHEERSKLRTALTELPARDRDILYYTYVLDLPATEIAEMLGMTPDNVWQRLSRARKKLLKSWEANSND